MRHLQDGSDATLIKQAQKGDGEAAGLLYDRYHLRIYRFVRARVATCEAAEDIIGEIFTRMVDHLPGYKERGRPFGAWLYQIGHNLLKDRYRQNGQVNHLPISCGR